MLTLWDQLTDRWTCRWSGCWKTGRAAAADWGAAIDVAEKYARERAVSLWWHRLERQARDSARRRAPELLTEPLLAAAREIALRGLGLPAGGVDLFVTRSAVDATRQFVHQAEEFDPTIGQASLLQALRNFWVFISLEIFLDHPIALTSPALGYSLLYPWTDNFLDHPGIAAVAKADFGRWLGARLRGLAVAPPGPHAAEVDALLSMVDSVFPRGDYPQVHLSLRAIHVAQIQSLQLHLPGAGISEETLSRITVAKGGASVLADGFLVRGHLSDAEADFIFGYGVLLQLMDDLQDRAADLQQGYATLFTRCSAPQGLDDAVSGVWSFAQDLFRLRVWSEAPRSEPLRAVLQENCRFLLFQSVARNHQAHTQAFVHQLESCSPLRFEFLAEREKTLGIEFGKLAGLLRSRAIRSSAGNLAEAEHPGTSEDPVGTLDALRSVGANSIQGVRACMEST